MATSEQDFEHQTGGHKGNFLKPESSKLMKAVSKDEGKFYAELKNYPELHKFLPKYYGSEERDGKSFVVLEDLTHYYKKPCIMDIKIGTQSFGEDAAPEKRNAMAHKDAKTTTISLGFRLTALNVHATSGQMKKRRKSWGKAITKDSMHDALEEFFTETKVSKKTLIEKYLVKLKEILAFIESHGKLRIYSSSLLFLYDAEDPKPEAPTVDVRMIDFAHVFPITDGGKDDGYILGLKNLIQYLETILKK